MFLLQNITDAEYEHVKRVCKDFQLKKLGEYHDLDVQSYALLLTDVFDNFRYMCIKIYELDSPNLFQQINWNDQQSLKRLK